MFAEFNPFGPDDIERIAREMEESPDEPATDEERVKVAVILVCSALHKVIDMIADIDGHMAEHHTLLNEHAKSITLLEQLMIGGDNELPS